MNRFCEACGAALNPENSFCEECGTPTRDELIARRDKQTPPNLVCWHLFSPAASEAQRQSAVDLSKQNCVCGLIVTDTKRVREVFGADSQKFKDAVSDYSGQAILRGVCYHVVDVSNCILGSLSSPGWQQYVHLLQRAVQAHLKYTGVSVQGVFLLGGNDFIPMAIFKNHAGDPDADIESDLPYSTLQTGDPWHDGAQALSPALCVGRLPVADGFPLESVCRYLSNAAQAAASFPDDIIPFGLSAKQWERTSNHIYESLFGGSVHTSPRVDLENIEHVFAPEATFQYFNLHGASEEPYWYGQDGSAYPEAFAPEVVAKGINLNVIGVEACYGARFIDLSPQQSILLSALAHTTVAFLGASRIAFGPVKPPIGLADVVIHQFLDGLQKGATAGAAMNAGRLAVLNAPDLEPMGIKTILEFNLFGDPLLAVRTPAKLQPPIQPPSKSTPAAVIVLPDVLSLVQAEVNSIRQTIRRTIDAHVYQQYPALMGVEPATAKVILGASRHELTRFAYHAKRGPVAITVLIYADERGNIAQEFVSK